MTLAIEQVAWSDKREQLLAVRYAVFVDEQGVPAGLEQDAHDADALHLLVRTAAGAPVATARMLPDGHIGRMAVLPEWRGQGIGSRLLQTLTALAAERRLGHVFLHAQCQALPFYRRLGFIEEGHVFVDAGIDHQQMVLPLDPL